MSFFDWAKKKGFRVTEGDRKDIEKMAKENPDAIGRLLRMAYYTDAAIVDKKTGARFLLMSNDGRFCKPKTKSRKRASERR